jgi:SM-20-related protein
MEFPAVEPETLAHNRSEALDRAAPYSIWSNFLGEDSVRHLLHHAEVHQEEFRASTVGSYDKDIIAHSVRVSSSLKKIGSLKNKIEKEIFNTLPSMFTELGCLPFEPIELEIGIVAHGHGAVFTRHIDTYLGPATGPTIRMITMVYYFYAIPKAFSGGILRLHSLAASGREGSFVDIEPKCDMAVFFPSWFPHEVLPISCRDGDFMSSRFAINCWLHKQKCTRTDSL